MKFSIIVPVYKTEKYIEQCFNSIKAQTFDDFEVIAVDDGSPDACPEIIDRYAQSDKRFIPLHKHNGGLVSARKAGASFARGEYILNVDSDDYIKDDMLEEISKAIEAENADAVFFGFTMTDGDNLTGVRLNAVQKGYYTRNALKTLEGSYLYDSSLPGLNGGCILFNICCKAVKRELYKECQNAVPDSVVSGEDTVFSYHLLKKADSVTVTDIDGYYYRQNPSSIEHNVSSRDFENLNIVCNEMIKNSSVGISNPISSYALQRIWALGIRSAKNVPSYKAFKAIINTRACNDIRRIAAFTKISSSRFPEKIAIYTVKKKRDLLLYILANTWFKNKDM